MRMTLTTAAVVSLLTQAAAWASDWPQLAHDAQRTGRSPDSPHPPFTLAWHHTIQDGYVNVWNQPVLAGGSVFIGTVEGNMHCWPLEDTAYKAAGGKDTWTFGAGAPILGAAGFENNRIFFGAENGCCYALDSTGGALLWKTDVGRPGFSQAALLAEGKVFLGARSGKFYAFDQADGRILWQYDTGAPILVSSAYAGGRVFCGSEDMKIRALDASTGELAWESDTLPGTGLLNHFLVADAGKVVVRTKPFTRFHTTSYSYSVSLREEGQTLRFTGWHTYPEAASAAGEAFWRAKDAPRAERFADFNAAMREAFAADPEVMTFHALDAATGRRAYIVPVVYNMINVGPAHPPVVGADGFWYVGTAMTGKGNRCEVAKVDPQTGDVVDALQDYVGGYDDGGWGGEYFTVMPDGSLSGDLFLKGGWTGDEDNMFSIGGKVLYGRHGHGGWDAIDIETRIPFSHKSHQSKYKSGYEITRATGLSGNAFTGVAISGEYLVGTQVAGFGVLFCVKGVKGE